MPKPPLMFTDKLFGNSLDLSECRPFSKASYDSPPVIIGDNYIHIAPPDDPIITN